MDSKATLDPTTTTPSEEQPPSSFSYAVVIAVLSLTLLIPPFAFYLVLYHQHAGGLPASLQLSHATRQYPRITAQVVTILASIYVFPVYWVFGSAVTILAEKYFRREQKVHKLEFFLALKNLTGLFCRGSLGLAFATWIVVVIGSLLTQGFVSLINPLPIAFKSDIANSVGLQELDFSVPSESCDIWYNVTLEANMQQCDEITYPGTNFTYTTCPLEKQLGQVLASAQASMVEEFASDFPSEERSRLASSFSQLSRGRLIGSTAGTLPSGPQGVHQFPGTSFSILPRAISFNYTLQLQGIWSMTSCSYYNSSAPLFSLGPGPNGTITYDVLCPADQHRITSTNSNTIESFEAGFLLAGACLDPDIYTIHLQSFLDYQDYLRQTNSSSSSNPTDQIYSGIGRMQCTVIPQIGLVNAAYQSDLQAFNMTPLDSGYKAPREASKGADSIAQLAIEKTIHAISDGQTTSAGNFFGGLIHSTLETYSKVDGDDRHPLTPGVVADAIRGIFEYQATHWRLVLTGSNGTRADPSCYRSVTGSLVEDVIGWRAETSMVIGLIPLLLVCFGGVALIIWAMCMGGGIRNFDPTSPQALLAGSIDPEGVTVHIDHSKVPSPGKAIRNGGDEERLRTRKSGRESGSTQV